MKVLSNIFTFENYYQFKHVSSSYTYTKENKLRKNKICNPKKNPSKTY